VPRVLTQAPVKTAGAGPGLLLLFAVVVSGVLLPAAQLHTLWHGGHTLARRSRGVCAFKASRAPAALTGPSGRAPVTSCPQSTRQYNAVRNTSHCVDARVDTSLPMAAGPKNFPTRTAQASLNGEAHEFILFFGFWGEIAFFIFHPRTGGRERGLRGCRRCS